MSQPTIAVCAVQGAFIEHEQRLTALGCEVFELRQAADLARPFDALVLPGGESTVQAKLLRELDMFDTLRSRIASGLPVLGTCAGLILLAERIEDAAGDLAGLDPKIAAVRTTVTGFGTLPVTVQRNGYGRQLGSFHAYASFGSTANDTRRVEGTEEAANAASTGNAGSMGNAGGTGNAGNTASARGAVGTNSAGDTASAKGAGSTRRAEGADSAEGPERSSSPIIPMTFIRAPFITRISKQAGAEALARVDGRIVAARADNQIGVAFHPELDEDDTVYQMFLKMI